MIQNGKEENRVAKEERCHDCNCLEGEIHSFGCDVEECPFCGGQLLSCYCCYEKLGIDCSKGTYTYEHGLTEAEEEQWIKILEKKGRIPYVVVPITCALCGTLWPDFFMVTNKEWKKHIIPKLQDKVLCIDCYEEMIKLFPDGWKRK